MVANTIAINQQSTEFADRQQVWLFGYGSLIYKAGFPFIKRQPAFIRHYSRRFWQGSHDHRGTPENPGRVVTLIEEPGAVCMGMAYLISPSEFAQLDYREKNGYLRVKLHIYFQANDFVEGLVYIADADNSAFLGPASELDIARHIAKSQGPSGHNRDYLLALADAIRELQGDDPHVFAIEQHLISSLNDD